MTYLLQYLYSTLRDFLQRNFNEMALDTPPVQSINHCTDGFYSHQKRPRVRRLRFDATVDYVLDTKCFIVVHCMVNLMTRVGCAGKVANFMRTYYFIRVGLHS